MPVKRELDRQPTERSGTYELLLPVCEPKMYPTKIVKTGNSILTTIVSIIFTVLSRLSVWSSLYRLRMAPASFSSKP